MDLWLKILLIILVILVIALIVLYFVGSRMQKKQAQQQQLMEQMSQSLSILVVSKKRCKLKEAGFPKIVLDQTPKYARRAKVNVVKARVDGPNKIMNFMCDEKVFDVIPVNKKSIVIASGIYITGIKSTRGSIVAPPAKKKGFRARLAEKASKTGREAAKAQKEAEAAKAAKKAAKASKSK